MKCTPTAAALSAAALVLAGFATPAYASTEEPTPTDPPTTEPPVADTRPNVVVVLADDLGVGDLSSPIFGGGGSTRNESPALDAMAAEGTVYTNAYSSPSCSPTRLAMMTGLAAPRPDNNSYQVVPLFGNENNTDIKGITQGDANEKVAIRPATTTVAEVAQAAGYETHYAGKFHATLSEADITGAHGYDVNYGGRASGAAERYPTISTPTGPVFDPSVGVGLNGPGANPDGSNGAWAQPYTEQYIAENIAPFSQGLPAGALESLVGKPKNVNDAIGDMMVSEVGLGGDPTFSFIGQYTIHDPVGAGQVRDDLRAKYTDRLGSATDSNLKIGYAGLIENMDQNMARLRRFLETTEDPRNPGQMLDQNTVVIFKSDNGGRTQLTGDNGPFTGQKFETTEGGVRVPMFAWSGNPALVAPGAVDSSVVRDVDLLPTVTSLVGGTLPTTQPVDGRSFAPGLTAQPYPNVNNVVHLPGWFVSGGRNAVPSTTLRRPNGWKIVYRYANRSWALYNLSSNPAETINYRDTRTTVAEPMANEVLDYLGAYTPGLPTLRAGRPTITVDSPAGTRFYRYGQVKVLDARRDIVIRPGDEVPVILRPGFTGNRK